MRGRVAWAAVPAAFGACLVLLLAATVRPSTPFDAELVAPSGARGVHIATDTPAQVPRAAAAVTTPVPVVTMPVSLTGQVPATTAPSAPAPVPNRPPVVLVVGDSGAFYLGGGMAAVQDEFGVGVVNRGAIGCGLVRTDGRLRRDDGTVAEDPAGCAAEPDRWRGYLAQFHPDRVLLNLASFGGGKRFLDGRWVDDCDPAWLTYFTGRAADAMRLLESGGARVTVTTIPYVITPMNPDFRHRETDCANRALVAAARAVPGTGLLDLHHWACPTPRCRGEQDGVVLRPDLVHFAGPGGEIAGRWVLSQLGA